MSEHTGPMHDEILTRKTEHDKILARYRAERDAEDAKKKQAEEKRIRNLPRHPVLGYILSRYDRVGTTSICPFCGRNTFYWKSWPMDRGWVLVGECSYCTCEQEENYLPHLR
jgi:hypothetical protein